MPSDVLESLISELERTLRPLLTEERDRVVAERDFLLKVLDGGADGVSVEQCSSDLTETYLSSSLERYFSI